MTGLNDKSGIRRVAFGIIALWLVIEPAYGTIYKCVSKDGNVSYQSKPCDRMSSETTIREPKAPPKPATRPTVYVNPVPSSLYDSSSRRDFDMNGPLETWDRFAKAWNSGDKQGVMKELTPGMGERFGPTYDALHKK